MGISEDLSEFVEVELLIPGLCTMDVMTCGGMLKGVARLASIVSRMISAEGLTIRLS